LKVSNKPSTISIKDILWRYIFRIQNLEIINKPL
jgi:hypothetical protein